MTTRNILITGANRGLGLGFTKRYLATSSVVFAGVRDPENARELLMLQKDSPHALQILPMDVTNEDSIRAAVDETKRYVKHLDLIINNAGRYGERRDAPLEDLNLDDLRLSFEINTLGPLRVTRAFLSLLRASQEKKLVHITSLMGSIADNSSGGAYGYRVSKAALNMLNRNLAHELKKDGVTSIALHPGWVQTDMGGKEAPMTVEESISAMMNTIEKSSLEQSGHFLKYDGSVCPF